jgi:hypothetical protein
MSQTQIIVNQPISLSSIASKIIGTTSAKLKEEEKAEISNKIKEVQTSTPITSYLWNARTNQPYKNIIDKPEYISKFFDGEKAKENFKEKDIVVHVVQESEKKETSEKVKILKSEIINHDNTLKKLYSSEEKELHFRNFERSKIFGDQVNTDSHEQKKEAIKSELIQTMKNEKEGKMLIEEAKKLTSQLFQLTPVQPQSDQSSNSQTQTRVIQSIDLPVSNARSILYPIRSRNLIETIQQPSRRRGIPQKIEDTRNTGQSITFVTSNAPSSVINVLHATNEVKKENVPIVVKFN